MSCLILDPGRCRGRALHGLPRGSGGIVGVPVAGTVAAAVKPCVEQEDVEELGESQDYDEGLQHLKPPTSPASNVNLLTCQPRQRQV